jgi:hypothetical protein
MDEQGGSSQDVSGRRQDQGVQGLTFDRFINQRGDGKGMKPYWREAGITHAGRGYNIGEDREFIKWGRVLSGRPSYINWSREGKLCNGNVICRIEYQLWENKGEGGTSQKGESSFYFFMPSVDTDCCRRRHFLGRHDW